MNKNFKYYVGENTYILSTKEHEDFQGMMKNGKNLISLREGRLIINSNFIRSVNETDEPIEKEKDNVMTLAQGSENLQKEQQNKVSDLLKETHNDFFKRMGWEHKEDCSCKI